MESLAFEWLINHLLKNKGVISPFVVFLPDFNLLVTMFLIKLDGGLIGLANTSQNSG